MSGKCFSSSQSQSVSTTVLLENPVEIQNIPCNNNAASGSHDPQSSHDHLPVRISGGEEHIRILLEASLSSFVIPVISKEAILTFSVV